MASTPKVTAKRNRSVPSTTSAKVTKSAILAHLRTARTANLSKGSKGYFTDEGAELLASAIAKASTLPTLASAGITTSKSREMASARRDFAISKKAILIDFSLVLAPNKEGEITHDRPENTIRARIFSIAKAMGLPQDTFYPVRASSYKVGELPMVYIVRK